MADPILEVQDLVKYYPIRRGIFDLLRRGKNRYSVAVRAVDGVSFKVHENDTFGLVGESGSGKTTLGRTIAMLQPPTFGKIIFKGRDITKLKGEELRQVRRKLQIVFQNPYTSLDPRQRVRSIVGAPLVAFGYQKDAQATAISKAIKSVRLPQDIEGRFPHQLSGGQRQRVAIARALVLDPEFIVLDEPTSALDASVQAQILNLLREIQDERGISFIFITHNVKVVKYMANNIGVLYSGKLVEVGPPRELLEHPSHPYTVKLIASVPQMNPNIKADITPLGGEVPSAINPPPGCRFNPRCPYAEDLCKTSEPQLREIRPNVLVACHLAEKISEIRLPSQNRRS